MSRKRYNQKQQDWLVEHVDAFRAEGVSQREACELVLEDARTMLSPTCSVKSLEQTYYRIMRRRREARSPVACTAGDDTMFIVRVPSLSGNGASFKYAKDQEECEQIVGRITGENGGVMPAGLAVFSKVEIKAKVEVTFTPMATRATVI